MGLKILKKNITKIQINQSDINFPSNVVGIDLGQTLTKIAYIEKENELNLLMLSTNLDYKQICEFLESNLINNKRLNFTGGRAFTFHERFLKKTESNLLNEFQSNAKGIEALYLLNKKKTLPNSLIINIGTGTFVLLKKQGFKHLGGSALGGGFFMGFIKLLYDMDDYQEAIRLAEEGDRYKVDLKVSDIYEPKDQRVNWVFREFTAASFGKIEQDFNLKTVKREDVINSIICLIGENLGSTANLMAKNHEVNTLVFCGGLLRNNRLLQRVFSTICSINKNKAIFIAHSEFCGAIGALLS